MSNLSDKELLAELERRFKENHKVIDELNKVTQELKIVNTKLKDSEALKSHFISNICNEIINPFTSIIGLTKSILEVKKEDWKTVITMVAHINTEAFNLDFQLKNIFAAAKIEAGEIYAEAVKANIKSIVENVINDFKYEARKKKISITSEYKLDDEDNFKFVTDPEKFQLIIANLVSNAIKFSYVEGKVEIKTQINNKKELEVVVRDYGEGINEANQQIIFDRFKRADSGINSTIRGHGLGLSINKAFLDLFDGEIKVDTKPNEGSTFTVTIPESEEIDQGMSHDGNEFIFDDGEIF
jgi:signal transduction histidine kinase